MTKLIYIADPMCSWCYGFGPELATLINGVSETPLEIIVGGLRAYNTEPMTEDSRATLLSHWDSVAQASGLPFSTDALSHDGFIYDTEPACRAVVAARILAPQATFDVFRAIQHGFYAEGMDTTKGDVLANISTQALKKAGVAIDPATFLATWSSADTIAAMHIDFAQTKQWGVRGFPTLVLELAGELHLVTSGFARTEALVDQLQALLDQVSDSSGA